VDVAQLFVAGEISLGVSPAPDQRH
jgi:hypothetical protein